MGKHDVSNLVNIFTDEGIIPRDVVGSCLINGLSPQVCISENLYISPAFRGKGWAARLDVLKIARAKELGYVAMLCLVNDANKAQLRAMAKAPLPWTPLATHLAGVTLYGRRLDSGKMTDVLCSTCKRMNYLADNICWWCGANPFRST